MNLKLNKKVLGSIIAFLSILFITACSPISNDSEEVTPSYIHGDVIDDKEVKDEFGSYMSTKLSPDAKSLIYNRNRTDITVYDAGFTDADAKAAQKWVAEWVAKQATDSIVLDNSSEQQKWVSENERSFSGKNKQILLDDISSENSSVVVSRLPLTVRDGKSRIINNSINIYGISAITQEQIDAGDTELSDEEAEKINAKNSKSEKYLQVYGIADTVYRITEENLIKYLIENSEGELTKEDLQAAIPDLKDGKDKKLINQLEFVYTIKETNNGWEIIGTNNNFSWNWTT